MRGYEKSVATLFGKVIADVAGYRADEFGDPCFKLTRIYFTDGTSIDIEGEHDFPYLCTSDPEQIARIAALEE